MAASISKVEELLKMNAGEFLRFIMNIEMEVSDSEFSRMWKELYNEISEAAIGGEVINANHKRLSKS